MQLRRTTMLATGLFSALAGCGAEPEPKLSAADARQMVNEALAPCTASAGALGQALERLDKDGDRLAAFRAGEATEQACRTAAVRIDEARARLSEPVHTLCLAAGELGETLGSTVQNATETPSNPRRLAAMEDAAEVYGLAKLRCDAEVSGLTAET